ncbi:hypothetical protein GJ496_008941 [Pomphorhynchus laevis]|nr:hypothetical protein GJ496_008941 [Pomphorhynchus laevis]
MCNLYIQITDELRKIEAYLTDEFKRDQQINSLYEIVQYNQFVLPRLYMMITVGVVYLNANILPRCELLRDMNEMCRGIQHPMRGLFLRNYLLQAVKNSLTTSFDSPISDGQSDDFSMNPLDFILMNFCEMNKLWVRLQYQGHSKEQAIREQERKELKLLVGTNILRLSQLTNLSLETYAESITVRL